MSKANARTGGGGGGRGGGRGYSRGGRGGYGGGSGQYRGGGTILIHAILLLLCKDFLMMFYQLSFVNLMKFRKFSCVCGNFYCRVHCWDGLLSVCLID